MTASWQAFTNPPPVWDQLAQQEFDTGVWWWMLLGVGISVGVWIVQEWWDFWRGSRP